MWRRKNRVREVNLLDLVPARCFEYEVDEAGIVSVRTPRFHNRLMRRWLEPRLKRPYFSVTLDEIGSALWLLCDGKRCVREIAGGLQERFGEKMEKQRDERLGLFFQQLEDADFIRFVNLEECRRAAAGGNR